MRGRGALSPPTDRCGGSSTGTPPSFFSTRPVDPCRSSSLIWHSPAHTHAHTHIPSCCVPTHTSQNFTTEVPQNFGLFTVQAANDEK